MTKWYNLSHVRSPYGCCRWGLSCQLCDRLLGVYPASRLPLVNVYKPSQIDSSTSSCSYGGRTPRPIAVIDLPRSAAGDHARLGGLSGHGSSFEAPGGRRVVDNLRFRGFGLQQGLVTTSTISTDTHLSRQHRDVGNVAKPERGPIGHRVSRLLEPQFARCKCNAYTFGACSLLCSRSDSIERFHTNGGESALGNTAHADVDPPSSSSRLCIAGHLWGWELPAVAGRQAKNSTLRSREPAQSSSDGASGGRLRADPKSAWGRFYDFPPINRPAQPQAWPEGHPNPAGRVYSSPSSEGSEHAVMHAFRPAGHLTVNLRGEA